MKILLSMLLLSISFSSYCEDDTSMYQKMKLYDQKEEKGRVPASIYSEMTPQDRWRQEAKPRYDQSPNPEQEELTTEDYENYYMLQY